MKLRDYSLLYSSFMVHKAIKIYHTIWSPDTAGNPVFVRVTEGLGQDSRGNTYVPHHQGLKHRKPATSPTLLWPHNLSQGVISLKLHLQHYWLKICFRPKFLLEILVGDDKFLHRNCISHIKKIRNAIIKQIKYFTGMKNYCGVWGKYIFPRHALVCCINLLIQPQHFQTRTVNYETTPYLFHRTAADHHQGWKPDRWPPHCDHSEVREAFEWKHQPGHSAATEQLCNHLKSTEKRKSINNNISKSGVCLVFSLF